jgi:hypothetical protein
MAQSTWINLSISPTGKHNSIGGDQNTGDLTLSYDPAKLTTAVSLETVLAALRIQLLGRGFR